MSKPRPESPRHNRPRGHHIPTHEVSAYLANGWRVLDECIGYDEVLLAPPVAREEAA